MKICSARFISRERHECRATGIFISGHREKRDLRCFPHTVLTFFVRKGLCATLWLLMQEVKYISWNASIKVLTNLVGTYYYILIFSPALYNHINHIAFCINYPTHSKKLRVTIIILIYVPFYFQFKQPFRISARILLSKGFERRLIWFILTFEIHAVQRLSIREMNSCHQLYCYTLHVRLKSAG